MLPGLKRGRSERHFLPSSRPRLPPVQQVEELVPETICTQRCPWSVQPGVQQACPRRFWGACVRVQGLCWPTVTQSFPLRAWGHGTLWSKQQGLLARTCILQRVWSLAPVLRGLRVQEGTWAVSTHSCAPGLEGGGWRQYRGSDFHPQTSASRSGAEAWDCRKWMHRAYCVIILAEGLRGQARRRRLPCPGWPWVT